MFHFVRQVLFICTDDRGNFSIKIIFLFYFNDFVFLLFNNLARNRHCIWIETRGPQKWLFLQSQLFLPFSIFLLNYFILFVIATSHIAGNNSNSWIWVGENDKPCTNIYIPTHSRICLEVNTHTGTLDYFINDKHIKDRVVNVLKDVYFGVWYHLLFVFIYSHENILI
jgi:hypothetical protein